MVGINTRGEHTQYPTNLIGNDCTSSGGIGTVTDHVGSYFFQN